ncbi:hypothetical protein PMAYCL1PPCAC_18727, partial [Pristionchus mayeri]
IPLACLSLPLFSSSNYYFRDFPSLAAIFRSYKLRDDSSSSSMVDRPTSGHGNRSLNLSQTLDELLGITKKEDNGQKTTSVTRIADLTQMRPPTRHGPEERTESVTISVVEPFSKHRRSWAKESMKEKSTEGEEDFIQRLNDERRRSIILLSPSSSKSNDDDGKTSQNGSIPSTASSEARTFRVEAIEEEEGTPRKEKKEEEKDEEKEEKKVKIEEGHPSTAKKKPPVPMPRSASASTAPKRLPDSYQSSTMMRPMSSLSGKSSHETWLSMKRERDLEQRRKQKQEEEEKKREEEEKKKAAVKVYERWKADREEKDKEKREKERERAKKKKEEKENEEKQKKAEAAKVFEAWKQERRRSMSESSRRRKEEDEREKMKKAREIEEKELEAQTAFESWSEKKREREREERMKKLQREKELMEKKEDKEAYREMLAKEAYQTWLEIKEKEEGLRDSLENKIAQFEEEITRKWSTPWRPPSNTVPRTFEGTGNRRKSLERRKGPSRVVSAHSMRRSASVKSIKAS